MRKSSSGSRGAGCGRLGRPARIEKTGRRAQKNKNTPTHGAATVGGRLQHERYFRVPTIRASPDVSAIVAHGPGSLNETLARNPKYPHGERRKLAENSASAQGNARARDGAWP